MDLVRPTFAELTAASFRVGVLGFGGPAAQIALMHRIFVDEKKWIDEPRYLHALNYCMLLPGPEAQQLATYVGWLLHGVKGGLVAGILFVLPGAFVVGALSWLYAASADAPLVVALFYGVKAAVLALVVEAVIKIGKRALKTRTALLIAAASFLALTLLDVPFPFVILAAAAIGAWGASQARGGAPPPPMAALAQPSVRSAFLAGGVSAAAWLAPLGLAFWWLGPDHVLTTVGGLFAHLSVITFGGAYAVLAYLQSQAVEVHGWLTHGQMIDGLGLAETTPGPLVLVNMFVGFLAGWQTSGGGVGLALACAGMAAWQTFAPSFVWIFAGAPYAEKLRANRFAAAMLSAITAAVLGVVATLALSMGRHVLFAAQSAVSMPGGARLDVPVLSSLDPLALALAISAAVALIRFKINLLLVLGACTLAGVLRTLA